MNEKKVALVSVSDKTDLNFLIKNLKKFGFEFVASSGTAKAIKKFKAQVVPLKKITGFEKLLDGRVKTLHPIVYAGILADRKNKKHLAELKKLGLQPFDLVVVNLYPFKKALEKNASLKQLIENIDIGGVALIRSAAKNYQNVAVVTSPKQYKELVNELEKNKGKIGLKFREKLAAEAFEETAFYDSLIQNFFHLKFGFAKKFPERFTVGFEKAMDLRYGENPHQKAAFYKDLKINEQCVGSVEQLQGKELSFNNILDANAAIELLKEFSEPTAVIVKHSNPCGVASASNISEAFKKALECDSKSAFGGIIALNRKCDLETAKQITAFFNEIVIALEFDKNALREFSKKKNLRVLKLPKIKKEFRFCCDSKKVVGGLLLQERDLKTVEKKDLKFVTEKKPLKEQLKDLLFAWKVVKHVKSNAIVLAKNLATVGIGAGQMSRVDAVELAVKKSLGRADESVLASDAFFPFADNIEVAAEAGVKAIIQPGGSVRDSEVIAKANQLGIAMVFTGVRHFRH